MSTTWSSFVSLYGEEPLPAWIEGLKDIPEDQLFAGYEKARDDNLEFPPNLSTFIEYCTGNNDWEHARQSRPAAEVLLEKPVDLGEGKLLEGPKDNRTPAEHLAEIRKMFHGGEPNE